MRRVLALAVAAVLCPLVALAADEPAPVVPKTIKPLSPAEVKQCEEAAAAEVARMPKLVPPAPVAPAAPRPRTLPLGFFARDYLGHVVDLEMNLSTLRCAGEIKDGEFTCRYSVTCECHFGRDGATVVGTVTGVELQTSDPKRVAPLVSAATDAAFAFELRQVGPDIVIRRVRTSARCPEAQPMLDAVTLALTGKFAGRSSAAGGHNQVFNFSLSGGY